MISAMAGGHEIPDGFVEGQQADGIALQMKKVRERRRERRRVVRLRITERAIVHRLALIDDELAAQIRFVLEFLDEVTVGARKDLPVEITQVVTRRVLAVLGEFHREAVIRAAMNAVPKTFDDRPRPQLETANR